MATPALRLSRQDFVPTAPHFVLATSVMVAPAAHELFGLAPLLCGLRNGGVKPHPTHVSPVPSWCLGNDEQGDVHSSLASCGQEGEGKEFVGHGFITRRGAPRMHLVQDHQTERKTLGFWETLSHPQRNQSDSSPFSSRPPKRE